MFITTLVFLACVAGKEPTEDTCQKVALPWDGSHLQCSLFAQQGIVQWLQHRPGLVLVGRHKCVTEPVGGNNV